MIWAQRLKRVFNIDIEKRVFILPIRKAYLQSSGSSTAR